MIDYDGIIHDIGQADLLAEIYKEASFFPRN
jgi:hypothetical protein